jgi:hypothetical protein
MSRMKRSAWILISVVVLLGLVAWLVFRPASEHVATDFVADFAKASEVRPPDAFSIVDATLAGETKRAIAVKQASRIAWNVTVPNNAWLHLSAGLTEDAWTVDGDGVLFRVSVNDDELLNVVINPFGDTSARRWQDFALDLSEFAGEDVKVFLKTNASAPGKNNTAGDSAVWGAPRIVTK